MPRRKSTTNHRRRKFIRKDSNREYASRSGMIEVGSTDGTSTYFKPSDLLHEDKLEKGKAVSTLRDKLKARREAESPSETQRTTIVTDQEIERRERIAFAQHKHEYEKCAICTDKIAPRRYFLSPRKHFPICGDCLTIAIAYPPDKSMKVKEATHYLQTIRAANEK